MDLAAVLVLRSNVQMIRNGVIRVVRRFSSPQPIFARRIMLFLMIMAAGVTHLVPILILLCLCSLRSLSTVLALSPSLTAGKQKKNKQKNPRKQTEL